MLRRNLATIIALFVGLVIGPRLGAQSTTRSSPKPSVLGEGQGLAEVIVLVRDLESTIDMYRDVLGFTFPPRESISTLPSGLRPVGAKFERKNYLELRSVGDREKATQLRRRFVEFLEKHEGAFLVVLDVSSARSTADFLRARGFTVNQESFPEFSVVSFEDYNLPIGSVRPGTTDASPTRALVFSQYAPPAEAAEAKGKLEEERRHPNTAKGIQSVWIAVRDLETATKSYESVGLRAGRRRNLPALGAIGREIDAGEAVILLVQPRSKKGRVASFLADRGEGIMGVSIEVSELETARQLLETHTNKQFASYIGLYGKSLLIPSELTHGLWIEFFQK